MSVQASSWAWRQRDKIESGNTFLVLLALAEHADPNGVCWPSRRTVAAMVGFKDKGTVTRHINLLDDLDLLDKDGRYVVSPESGGRQTSNRYRLKLTDQDGILLPDDGESPGTVAEELPLSLAPPATDPPSSEATPGTNDVEPSQRKEKDPTASGADPAQDVWDHYAVVFPGGAQRGLTDSRRRMIDKGLKDFTVAELCLAIDGLKRWRASKPGDESLSAIFKTRPGGSSFSDQLDWWMSQAPGSSGGGARIPSADRAIVAQRQQDVQRGHRLGTPQAMEKAEQAEAWLRRHGIITDRRPEDGYPVFRPARPDDGVEAEAARGHRSA